MNQTLYIIVILSTAKNTISKQHSMLLLPTTILPGQKQIAYAF